MAADFAGHSFDHTFIRSAPADMFVEPLQHDKIMAFVSKSTDELYPQILQAAPWVCAKCRQKPCQLATRVLLIKSKDPGHATQVINRSMPMCKKGACEVYARDNVRAALADSEAGAELPSACKTCGKLSKTSKCSQCKSVAYCSKECQKLDWPVHKAACKARFGQK